MTVRCSHPRTDSAFCELSHIADAIRRRIFVSDRDVSLRLDNLKRKRQVRAPRNAGHETLHFWVQCQTVPVILLLLRSRFRFVWNVTTVHDALTCRHGADCPQLIERPGLSAVIADVPVRGSQGLP